MELTLSDIFLGSMSVDSLEISAFVVVFKDLRVSSSMLNPSVTRYEDASFLVSEYIFLSELIFLITSEMP